MASPLQAGSIERTLGSSLPDRRPLESLASNDLNSQSFDSFLRGVAVLRENPDLSVLPSVRVGTRTVSLESIRPLVEFLKKMRETGPSGQPTSSLSQGIGLVGQSQISFATLESAIESSPMPQSAKSDLSRMVRMIGEFAMGKN